MKNRHNYLNQSSLVDDEDLNNNWHRVHCRFLASTVYSICQAPEKRACRPTSKSSVPLHSERPPTRHGQLLHAVAHLLGSQLPAKTVNQQLLCFSDGAIRGNVHPLLLQTTSTAC